MRENGARSEFHSWDPALGDEHVLHCNGIRSSKMHLLTTKPTRIEAVGGITLTRYPTMVAAMVPYRRTAHTLGILSMRPTDT